MSSCRAFSGATTCYSMKVLRSMMDAKGNAMCLLILLPLTLDTQKRTWRPRVRAIWKCYFCHYEYILLAPFHWHLHGRSKQLNGGQMTRKIVQREIFMR